MSTQGFNVDVWRNLYNRVKKLGRYLVDSYPDANGNPPLLRVSREERINVQEEIDYLLETTSDYLDKMGMKPKPPLWTFLKDDPRTWPSSPEFMYRDLFQDSSEAEQQPVKLFVEGSIPSPGAKFKATIE